jgi:xylulokinase
LQYSTTNPVNDLVLGVDSSTGSTKVELRHIDDGTIVATGFSPHPATTPPVSEQDPETWWRALIDAVGQLGEPRSQVAAIAIAGQQHGLVLLDDEGSVVRPAKLWNDTTSAELAEQLVNELGAQTWASLCGSVPVASFTITKLAWIAVHEPGSLARACQIMLPHDYLTWRLTGRHVTDRGDASGTAWFDAARGEYSTNLLGAAVGHPDRWVERLPEVLPHDQPAGELTPDAAAALGLPGGVVVGPGTGDNMAAALGLGLRSGDVAMSLGTSGTVYAVSDNPTADATGAVAGFADARGGFLPLVCTLNATKVTDKIATLLGTDAPGLAALSTAAPPEFGGVVVVPYFDGERTPNLPHASGMVHGLRTSTTREELAQAAHDGVLCGLLDGVDALAAAGVDTSGRLHLIGGGARSFAYQQRCADLLGEAIIVPDADEAVAVGAAVQAAAVLTGTGSDDLASAWALGSGTTLEPSAHANGPEIRTAYTAATSMLGSE